MSGESKLSGLRGLVSSITGSGSTSSADQSRREMPPPTAASTLSANSLGVVGQRLNRPRQKVVLAPGHSPLNWASLCATGSSQEMRGTDAPGLLKIDAAELAKHNTRESAWMLLKGRVYNITPYLEFHPGGADILLECAGADASSDFNAVHRWVNFEQMLGPCLVGIYVN